MDKPEINPVKKFAICMRCPIIIGAAIVSYFGARAIVNFVNTSSKLETKIEASYDESFEEPNQVYQAQSY